MSFPPAFFRIERNSPSTFCSHFSFISYIKSSGKNSLIPDHTSQSSGSYPVQHTFKWKEFLFHTVSSYSISRKQLFHDIVLQQLSKVRTRKRLLLFSLALSYWTNLMRNVVMFMTEHSLLEKAFCLQNFIKLERLTRLQRKIWSMDRSWYQSYVHQPLRKTKVSLGSSSGLIWYGTPVTGGNSLVLNSEESQTLREV